MKKKKYTSKLKKAQAGIKLLYDEDQALAQREAQQMQDYYNPNTMQPILPKVSFSTLPGASLPKFNPLEEEARIRSTALDISNNIPTPKRKKKSNIDWGQTALTGLLALDAIIPPEKAPNPVVRPTQSYNEHPYGTGSQAIANHGITISKDGYKSTSKDKNKSKLRIPSGNITMKGVGFPVLGTDNLGNVQYMLPGNDYQFPGSYVDEIPMAQNGATMKPQEIDYFNGFIDYVKQKGLQGSKKLNSGTLNEQLYSEYQKINPSLTIPLKDLTQKAQYTQHQQKQFDVNFAQRKQLPNAKAVASASISPIDNYFGSETSLRPIPKASLSTYHNNQLVQTKDLGYVPNSLNGSSTLTKKIPAGVKIEDVVDASGKKSRVYEDPQTGDLVNVDGMKKGGTLSSSKAKEMLRDGTAHGKKLTKKQKGYFGFIAGGGTPRKAEDGMTILDETTVKFNGPSHENGGQPIQFGGKRVEVEGDETGYLSPIDGSLTIGGNLKNPLTNRKFKSDFKILAEKEAKMDTLQSEGLTLINENSPMDKWSSLKFNSGKVMLTGAHKKKQELLSSKEHLKDLQEAMLEITTPQYTAKNGITIAQQGTTIPWKYNKTRTEGLDPKIQEFITLLTKKGLTGFSGPESGVSQRNTKSGRPSRHASGEALDAFLSQPDAYNKVLADPELSKFLIDNGLTVINEYDPETAKKTGATAGHLHIGYDKGTGISDKFRSDAAAKYKVTNPQWGWGTLRNPKGKTIKGAPQGDQQFFPYDPGKVGYTPIAEQTPAPRKKNPLPQYDFNFQNPAPYNMPTNAQGLEVTQILPELYTAATNKVEPVHMQKYQPELFEPYQVSYQDQLNENQASFSSAQKAAAYNPSALATLGAQKYSADSSVLANEFRTNQGIANDITNKNIKLLNDAELTNLGLADTQYTRQSQAKSNTKAINHQVLNSISSKVLQNKANQNKTMLYENLYRYRFDPENNYQAYNAGPGGVEYVDWNGEMESSGTNPANSTSIRRNATGQITGSTTNIPSLNKQQLEQYNIQNKKYKPIASMLNKGGFNKSFADWMASQGL